MAGLSLTLPGLTVAVESVSLLGKSNWVGIEELFARRPGREKTALINYLVSHLPENVTIWEGKDVSPQLISFPPGTIKRFDLPKHLFRFLDRPSLANLRLALSTAVPEIVFASLVTRLRKQIAAGRHDLVAPYSRLLAIDYQLKTSSLPYDLAAALELWVIKL